MIRKHDAIHMINIWIGIITVEWKTVTHISVTFVVWQVDFSTKPIQRHLLVVVVVQENFGHFK